MRRVQPAEPSRAQRAAAVAGALLLRALFATLRVRLHDPADVLPIISRGPVLYAFWHNRILAITAGFLRFYPAQRRGVLVLTSASKDGMWLGELAKHLGMGSVRGSSSRRGATAMRELLEKVAEKFDIAITPDGPRGPKYKMGAGLIYLAQKTGVPIIPVHARFGRCLRLRTWDRFAIPLPFSRVDILFSPPAHIPGETDEEAFEVERKKIESVLRAGAD